MVYEVYRKSDHNKLLYSDLNATDSYKEIIKRVRPMTSYRINVKECNLLELLKKDGYDDDRKYVVVVGITEEEEEEEQG